MAILIVFTVLLPFLLFIVPVKFKYPLLFILVGWICVFSCTGAIYALTTHSILKFTLNNSGIIPFTIVMDALSAFFILLINLTSVIGIIYGKGYLKKYIGQKTVQQFALHYFALFWLYLSMIFLCLFREGFAFLVAWEFMGISSFFLILFEAQERHVLKTAVNYLIQMHIALLFLIAAFFILEKQTGSMSLDALQGYFFNHSNISLFLLFFAGFGIKAGFIPLHTWLPEAHPAAPSHVSGIMSGVMIKMGIYGILRVVFNLQGNLLEIGIGILFISVFTGLYGIMQSVVQRDLKKALAFSSIENIGIIGIGIGVGVLAQYFQNNNLMLLAFSATLLHILNHSVFKPLLFYSAGNVYNATHTRNMDQLGGLVKKMPTTSRLFLVGAIALCGLPPLNGFLSEFLIFNSLFQGLQQPQPGFRVLFLFVIICLVLIGGIAIFSFVKFYGISFLGNARGKEVDHAHEVEKEMLKPLFIQVGIILGIAFFPYLIFKYLVEIVSGSVLNPIYDSLSLNVVSNLQQVSYVFLLFALMVWVFWMIKKKLQSKRKIEYGPTWGCGYSQTTPEQQYTSTSFTSDFVKIFRPVVRRTAYFKPIAEKEMVPAERMFYTMITDRIKTEITDKAGNFSIGLLRRIAVFQTGKIQHYILYALLFILGILVLTFFNWI